MTYSHETLRHCLATVAYRAAKSVRGAPEEFGSFTAFETTRTPAQILAHMGDLMDWGLAMSRGKPAWHNSSPLPWKQEIDRFFAALTTWDRFLASGEPLQYDAEKLFQGPIADAINHVGQINLLRRMAGFPVKGESY